MIGAGRGRSAGAVRRRGLAGHADAPGFSSTAIESASCVVQRGIEIRTVTAIISEICLVTDL